MIWKILLIQFYLLLIPLEHQHAVRLQHPETLPESLAQIITPGQLIQPSVLLRQPAILPRAQQMRRVKHHQAERTAGKRHIPEIAHNIRPHAKQPTIAKQSLQLPVIHEHRSRILRVIPAHPAPTARI